VNADERYKTRGTRARLNDTLAFDVLIDAILSTSAR
jgi:hypothetical protein